MGGSPPGHPGGLRSQTHGGDPSHDPGDRGVRWEVPPQDVGCAGGYPGGCGGRDVAGAPRGDGGPRDGQHGGGIRLQGGCPRGCVITGG